MKENEENVTYARVHFYRARRLYGCVLAFTGRHFCHRPGRCGRLLFLQPDYRDGYALITDDADDLPTCDVRCVPVTVPLPVALRTLRRYRAVTFVEHPWRVLFQLRITCDVCCFVVRGCLVRPTWFLLTDMRFIAQRSTYGYAWPRMELL